MPNKRNDARRHHIPKMRFKVGPVTLVTDRTGSKVYGAGEWHRDKHGVRGRRTLRQTGYGKRSKAETATARYKRILGDHLHARMLPTQQARAPLHQHPAR